MLGVVIKEKIYLQESLVNVFILTWIDSYGVHSQIYVKTALLCGDADNNGSDKCVRLQGRGICKPFGSGYISDEANN